jgi:AcrR family transcriptional regulator
VSRPQRGDLTPAARRVLAAAGELFYNQGINAVGVDAIAKQAGVTKKTLYDRFGSKDQLIVSYLQERDERWRRWLADEVDLAASDAAPTTRILATFDAQRTWMARESPRGCSFVNAAAELPDPVHPARAVIRAQKEWLRTYLLDECRATRASQPEQLADELLLLHEGANVLTGLGIAADPWATARRLAADLLDADGVGRVAGRSMPM